MNKREHKAAGIAIVLGIIVGLSGLWVVTDMAADQKVGPACARLLNLDRNQLVPLLEEAAHLKISDPTLAQCTTSHAAEFLDQILGGCRGGASFDEAATLAIDHITDVACADEYQASIGR